MSKQRTAYSASVLGFYRVNGRNRRGTSCPRKFSPNEGEDGHMAGRTMSEFLKCVVAVKLNTER